MEPIRPSRAELRQVKSACIAALVRNNICTKTKAKDLRRLHVDALLDFYFTLADAVTLTLKDGRRIVIHPGGRVFQ